MNTTPRALQEQLNNISEELFTMCQEMANIAERKGTAWLEIKRLPYQDEKGLHLRTNAEVDQMWSASDDGKRENYLKWYIKGLQARRGAIKMELESNNGRVW